MEKRNKVLSKLPDHEDLFKTGEKIQKGYWSVHHSLKFSFFHSFALVKYLIKKFSIKFFIFHNYWLSFFSSFHSQFIKGIHFQLDTSFDFSFRNLLLSSFSCIKIDFLCFIPLLNFGHYGIRRFKNPFRKVNIFFFLSTTKVYC